ncbi:MAG: isochorismatase family protein [Anaerolineales bacterium]|nr:isochorismatase family protein [Anaerolineales bacterium]
MRKETYFTPETLAGKSAEMLAEVRQFRRSHSQIRFVPAVSALLVLDMQAYFLQEDSHAYIPSAPAVLPGIRELVRTFSAQSRPVYLTRHVNTDEDAGMMASWWRDLIRPGTPESEIVPWVDPQRGTVLTKRSYDAFLDTNLDALLRAAGVSQLVVSGVLTHLCCETSARSAFTRGYQVFFVVDGTATYTKAFHRATVLNLAHGFAVPVTVAEILGWPGAERV